MGNQRIKQRLEPTNGSRERQRMLLLAHHGLRFRIPMPIQTRARTQRSRSPQSPSQIRENRNKLGHAFIYDSENVWGVTYENLVNIYKNSMVRTRRRFEYCWRSSVVCLWSIYIYIVVFGKCERTKSF